MFLIIHFLIFCVSQNSIPFLLLRISFHFVFLRIQFHFCVSQNSVLFLFSVSPIGSDLSMRLTEVNFTSSTISHVVIVDFLCLLNGTSG